MDAPVSQCASGGGVNASEKPATDWRRLLLREHPALILSGLYVAASVVGMFYAWAYLRRFGINVFNYAAISDFLLASLKEPLTWGLVIVAVGLVMWDNSMSRRYERNGKRNWLRWYGTPRYRLLNNFGAICLVFTFLFIYADYRADTTRGGEGKSVTVILADKGAAASTLLLGTTSQFVFLYDADASHVDIHPIENIQSISFAAPD